MKKVLIVNLLWLALFWANPAHAVELNGFSLGPSIVDITVKPGESCEQEFTVRNNSDTPARLDAFFQDYLVENDQWHAVENPDTRWSPMSWATILYAPEELQPGERGKIQARFEIPGNAEMGEHLTYFHAKFMPTGSSSNDAQSSGIVFASEIRSLVYVKVTDAKGNLDIIQSWRINSAGTSYWNFGKPVFTVGVTNTGNVHLEVRGNVAINDGIRNQRTELSIPLFNVLPGKEKEMHLSWDEAPFIGSFNGTMRLTYDGSAFEERQFSFIIVPLMTLAGIVLSFAGIILAAALYIRKLKMRLAAAERRQDNYPGV